TMIQPNCYWTLKTPLVTIIGLFSNVNGKLDHRSQTQEDWLIEELTTGKDDRCVIVAVHHPAYSLDNVHGGSPAIENALDKAFNESGRIPNLVMTGHVHNYQRFKRDMGDDKMLTYVVAGAGGYCGYTNIHQFKKNAQLPDGVELKGHNTKL